MKALIAFVLSHPKPQTPGSKLGLAPVGQLAREARWTANPVTSCCSNHYPHPGRPRGDQELDHRSASAAHALSTRIQIRPDDREPMPLPQCFR
ncbi:hypothetical protein PoB_001330300 [Plakobranchus ocellatus]|uniref:Uncharacterized protein n=1 Tax=Plakobranchus ocellatus TaxID=259542 RepID=A0AAV3YX36_9GAST|nr:hypothetical protein PoB_001330300 [Plakobranchus ocellatus]